MNKTKEFEQFGCVLCKQFIDPLTIQTVSWYLENKIRRQEWRQTDSKDPTSKFAYYADPLIEVLLKANIDQVEEICGKELHPTYSFARVYQPGEKLESHTDRPSCEVSVTVSVAYKGNPSEIWMRYKENDSISYQLEPGDAVVYKGCEAYHWREPLNEDQLVIQFMLHYVDKNGPFNKHKYDTRPDLGFSSSTRSS